jgi:UDP-N-acetylmuramoylalanine--D-glutamate ligase
MTRQSAPRFAPGDTVLVIGVGRSGLAAAEVLRAQGVSVAAYDDRPREQLSAEAQVLSQLGVPLIGAGDLRQTATVAKGVIVSPGVALTNAAVKQMQAAGVPVISEIELAYRLSDAPIIAITGSKGKSTTTALIGHLLRSAGKTARVGGNIGNPLIRETAAARAGDWVVAEVSSFQLESIAAFAPRISVLLNISPDHLDRYGSMQEYAQAKFRIFANQTEGDVFVGNADDPACAALRAGVGSGPACSTLWFGSEMSRPQPDASIVDGQLLLRVDGQAVPLQPAHALRLRGAHNVQNALAAVLAAWSAGVDVDALRAGLASFAPLPHRLTIVGEYAGVTWVDDSKATNPDAAIKALEAFAAPIILIAGGKSKKTDFAAFGRVAAQRTKHIVLIGEAAHEIAAHVSSASFSLARTLAEAVDTARRLAKPGDVVLLSPACASFDMFASAEQRGELFAQLARGDKATPGMVAS